MSAELNIVALVPSLFNPNGDAENARVLARRCEWAGVAARVVAIETSADVPAQVDGVVIGSCADSDLPLGLAGLRSLEGALRGWIDAEAPVLAIGNGWELLAGEIVLADGQSIRGLGLLEGSALPRAARVVGELVIASSFGTIVGYENHGRDIVGGGAVLGRVLSGVGNGADSTEEGVISGSVFGTHLHGPVLAKNPVFADHLLTRAAERAGLAYRPSERTALADGYAAAARRDILNALKLTE